MRASHGEGVHFRYNVHAQLVQLSLFLTAQNLHRLYYFKRVSYAVSERLVHVRYQRGDLSDERCAHFYHLTCESLCVVGGLHKRAAAVLYVKDYVFRSRSKLF